LVSKNFSISSAIWPPGLSNFKQKCKQTHHLLIRHRLRLRHSRELALHLLESHLELVLPDERDTALSKFLPKIG